MDIIRVQDTLLYQATDPAVLEWAATEDRILLTHDVQTMTKHAYDRIRTGLPMPGLIEVHDDVPTGQAIEEILIVLTGSRPGELVNRLHTFHFIDNAPYVHADALVDHPSSKLVFAVSRMLRNILQARTSR